jgi:diacylglycerol kinase (ATP)
MKQNERARKSVERLRKVASGSADSHSGPKIRAIPRANLRMSRKTKTVRAKLIVNTGAGAVVKQASLIEQVTKTLMDHGLQVDVALAHPIRHAERIARKAAKDGYDVVIGMGGDGTLGAVIRGIYGAKVHFGIIAAGTSNDFARSLGIPEDFNEQCALIASGHTRKVDLAELRTKRGGKFVFFMVTAIGLIATVYPKLKNVPEGKYADVKDAVRLLLNFDSKAKVFLTLDDGSRMEVETPLVTITNTPLIGLKNLVEPDASLEDGLLDVSVYPGFSKADVLAYFARTANERPASDERVERYRARKIKVETSPKLDIAAEGIVLGKGKAWIKALPGALNVFAPVIGAGMEKPVEEVRAKQLEPAQVDGR